MTYYYTDAGREGDPHALPDVEVAQLCTYCRGKGSIYRTGWVNSEDCPGRDCDGGVVRAMDGEGNPIPISGGWYYASGSPGCPWDSDPVGPFDTEAEALAAAREAAGFCAHGVVDDGCSFCGGTGSYGTDHAKCERCRGTGTEICEECPAPELWTLAEPDELQAVAAPTPPLPHTLTTNWTRCVAWSTRQAAEDSISHFCLQYELHPVRLSDADARRWGKPDTE